MDWEFHASIEDNEDHTDRTYTDDERPGRDVDVDEAPPTDEEPNESNGGALDLFWLF